MDDSSSSTIENVKTWDCDNLWGQAIITCGDCLQTKLKKLNEVKSASTASAKDLCEFIRVLCDIVVKLFNHAVNGGIQIELAQIFPKHSNLGKILMTVLNIDTADFKSVLLKERSVNDAVYTLKMLPKDLLVCINRLRIVFKKNTSS